jgi:serine protease Do
MWKWVLWAALLTTVAAGTTWSVVSADDDKRETATEDEDVLRVGPQLERAFRVFGDNDAQIGVSIRDVESGATAGARVEDVREGSAADKAGVQDGDVITEFDGERVRSARQLSRLVAETPAGRTVTMKVQRGSQAMDIKVTPEAGAVVRGPHVRIAPMPPVPPMRYGEEFFGVPDREWFHENRMGPRGRTQTRLGVGVLGLTGQLAEYFGAKDGVLVTTVREGSPAEAAGLKAGDVITAVDGKTVGSPAQLADAVRESEEGDVEISYLRSRQAGDVTVKLPAGDRPKPKRSARPA